MTATEMTKNPAMSALEADINTLEGEITQCEVAASALPALRAKLARVLRAYKALTGEPAPRKRRSDAGKTREPKG